jgi:hypothetical protein
MSLAKIINGRGFPGARIRRQTAAQTENLFDVVDETGIAAPWFRINKDGYLVVKKNAAPADADLSAGEVALWFDSTNGAARVMFKGKQADGSVWTGNDKQFISVTGWAAALGTPAQTVVTRHVGWLFDASSVEIITGGLFRFPDDWATYHGDLYWTNAGAGSGNVRWNVSTGTLADGVALSNPQGGGEGAFAAPASGTVEVSRVINGATSPSSANALNIQRMATDGTDTLTNDATVLGLLLSKAT